MISKAFHTQEMKYVNNHLAAEDRVLKHFAFSFQLQTYSPKQILIIVKWISCLIGHLSAISFWKEFYLSEKNKILI